MATTRKLIVIISACITCIQVSSTLSPETCASYDRSSIWNDASSVQDTAAAQLLASGQFARVVNG
jgi:hypothetical protein